jgi:hypothetical protein
MNPAKKTYEPKTAKARGMKDVVFVAMDEAFTAFEECLHDLTDEQIWDSPIRERHSIGDLVEHSLLVIDMYLCQHQVGRMGMEHDYESNLYGKTVEEVRKVRKRKRSVGELLDGLRSIRDIAAEGLAAATEDDLLGPRCAEEWCEQFGRNSLETYLRGIMHTNAHIRQIWLLRGALGLTERDKDGWPTQHYH